MKSCENCRYRKIDENALPCSACIELGQDLSGWVGMTNADNIRAMTDEELSDFLDDVLTDGWNAFEKSDLKFPYTDKEWLEWLKQGWES